MTAIRDTARRAWAAIWPTLLTAAGTGLCLYLIVYNGQARAAAIAETGTASPDPTGLLALLLSAQWLPAVGSALVMAVGLARYGAAKIWPWFATKRGGYVLAYVTTYALYLGTAWQSGAPFDPRLLVTAFGAALAASGVLDHWRDLFGSVTAQQVGKATAAAALIAIAFGALASVTSCAAGSTARRSGSTGVVTAMACEEQHFDPQLLADAKAFADATVGRWLSGTGPKPTTDAIVADLKPLKSDLFHCAFEGAVAAATTALTPQPGVATSALTASNAAEVRTNYDAAKARLGWR